MAFAESAQFFGKNCSAQAGCPHCGKTDALHPVQGTPGVSSSSCCPLPSHTPVALETDCICTHFPGTPLADAAMAVSSSTATKFSAIPVPIISEDSCPVAGLDRWHATCPTRGDPLPRPFLYIRNMSFRI